MSLSFRPRRAVAGLAAAALPLMVAMTAQAADTASSTDKAFVAKVSQGGMFEVAASKLVADRAEAQDVKDLGAWEVHDHELVGDKLKSIASKLDIKIDSDLNADFQKQVDALKPLKGPEFDKAYLSAMQTIHDKDGAAFAQEAKTGTDPDLKGFAAETYRIVRRHIGALHPNRHDGRLIKRPDGVRIGR